jgi:hypothetical protein
MPELLMHDRQGEILTESERGVRGWDGGETEKPYFRA